MLKNRSIQVKMVKDSNLPESEPIDLDKVIRQVTRSVIICTIVYVGADTVRRAAIYALSAI